MDNQIKPIQINKVNKVSNLFRNSFEFVSRHFLHFIAFFVFQLLVSFILNFIPFGAVINYILLSIPFTLGYAIYTKKYESGNEKTDFQTFFEGFNKVGKLSVLAFLVFVINFILGMFLIMSLGIEFLNEFKDFDPKDTDNARYYFSLLLTKKGIFLLFGVIFLITNVLVIFAPFLVYFNNYSYLNSLSGSIKMIFRNPIAILKLLVLGFLIIMLGSLCFFVGILIAVPILNVTIYYLFRKIVDGSEKSISIE